MFSCSPILYRGGQSKSPCKAGKLFGKAGYEEENNFRTLVSNCNKFSLCSENKRFIYGSFGF